MSAIGWALLIIFYTAICAIWSGILTQEQKPSAAFPDELQRWQERAARRVKRIWIWQAGLALIMVIWWWSIGHPPIG